ncbi:hypothetical protein CLV98_1082 [Dyadobacter jejuensis]|uniref:Uncharacterized protein n=1 Tax=Dyadobacter jejuensis TaxID=1082580 RepID=A0A316AHA3_9BACT|nr:hypothetical protein CLV98_1082 [Dyadobacter jejuensis]
MNGKIAKRYSPLSFIYAGYEWLDDTIRTTIQSFNFVNFDFK